MTKAIWNGAVIAESDDIVMVDNNPYFPRSAVNDAYLKDSERTSVCGWKGTASYFTLVVDGAENTDAAWYYPTPKAGAANIAQRVAFWRGVEISD